MTIIWSFQGHESENRSQWTLGKSLSNVHSLLVPFDKTVVDLQEVKATCVALVTANAGHLVNGNVLLIQSVPSIVS